MQLTSTNPFQQQTTTITTTSPHSFSSFIFFHLHSFSLFFSNTPISFLFLSPSLSYVMVQKPIFVLLVMCTVQKEKSFKWGFLSFSCLWSTLVLLVFSAVDGCVQHIKVVKCVLSLCFSLCFSLSQNFRLINIIFMWLLPVDVVISHGRVSVTLCPHSQM
ncbi:hypothetical protein VNO78_16192 [Psophocarpus tetragonolobus]|uniref:Transmembrane protein n=1 Tax=Psophocarpus tetragonolobus TaxID=3891 RepID=A0AAN9SFD1_PSOTE